MVKKFLLNFKPLIFTAMITWNAPSKQLQRGCMAWQEWNYEVLVMPNFGITQSIRKQEGISLANIKETSYFFNKAKTSLKDTIDIFGFSVRATSSSGKVNPS